MRRLLASTPNAKIASRARPSASSFRLSAVRPGPSRRATGWPRKKSGVRDQARCTKPKPISIIAWTAIPTETWRWPRSCGIMASIFSTRPCSSTRPATRP
jgi:hypothetical protein